MGAAAGRDPLTVHHVVAGLLVRGTEVLLGHRSPGRRWYPDVWDLPGGHVEDGELHLALFVVRSWDGEPRNLQPHEHDELRWVPAADVHRLRLAHPAYGDVVGQAVARAG